MCIVVIDTARTESWSLARQNLQALRGAGGCGLAEDSVVASISSMQPIAHYQNHRREALSREWSPPPVKGLASYTLESQKPDAMATPWFPLPSHGRFGFFVGGAASLAGELTVEWGRRHEGGVKNLGKAAISAQFESTVPPRLVRWRFLPRGELPDVPRGADLARVSIVANRKDTVRVTSAVTYRNELLADRLRRGSARPLIAPQLLMYFPCARQPQLESGIVEVPSEILAVWWTLFPIFGRGIGPFEGLTDLYGLVALPLVDSPEGRGNLMLFELDRRIAGGRIAHPYKTTRS
jgi:hypothetical protein